MAVQAGKAMVKAYMDDTEFGKGLARAQTKLKLFAGNVEKVAAPLKSLSIGLLAVGGAALAGFGLAAKTFAKFGDDLDKMSQRTGITATELSEMSFAAEQAGSSMDSLEKGVRTMQRGLFDAKRGAGEMKDAMAELGLTFTDLNGLSPADQMQKLFDRMKLIEDPTMKAGVAMKVFGKAGTELLPMMGTFGELREEARRLGLTISQDDVKAAARLTDAMNRVRRTLIGVAVQIGSALAPTLEDMAGKIVAVVAGAAKWVKENKETIVAVAKLAAVVAGVGVLLGATATGLYLLAKASSVTAAVMAGLPIIIKAVAFALTLISAHPVIAVITLLAGSIVALMAVLRLTKKPIGDMSASQDTLTKTTREATSAIGAQNKALAVLDQSSQKRRGDIAAERKALASLTAEKIASNKADVDAIRAEALAARDSGKPVELKPGEPAMPSWKERERMRRDLGGPSVQLKKGDVIGDSRFTRTTEAINEEAKAAANLAEKLELAKVASKSQERPEFLRGKSTDTGLFDVRPSEKAIADFDVAGPMQRLKEATAMYDRQVEARGRLQKLLSGPVASEREARTAAAALEETNRLIGKGQEEISNFIEKFRKDLPEGASAFSSELDGILVRLGRMEDPAGKLAEKIKQAADWAAGTRADITREATQRQAGQAWAEKTGELRQQVGEDPRAAAAEIQDLIGQFVREGTNNARDVQKAVSDAVADTVVTPEEQAGVDRLRGRGYDIEGKTEELRGLLKEAQGKIADTAAGMESRGGFGAASLRGGGIGSTLQQRMATGIEAVKRGVEGLREDVKDSKFVFT